MLLNGIRKRVNRSMERWLDQHNPAGRSHYLHLKNLFIYPTKLGWAFLFLAFIIWLLGTNYQNNLILALAYFQLSLFTVCILLTYHNLSGLKITFLNAQNVYSEETATIQFSVECMGNKNANYVSIYFQYLRRNIFDFYSGEIHYESLLHPTGVRGKQDVVRLRVESRFPMGLIKCGSWLRFDSSFLVYPKAEVCEFPDAAIEQQEAGEYQVTRERQEFYGFRSYAPGDNLSAVAWKQWAKGRGLMSVTYANPESPLMDLSWSQFFKGDKEKALSHLCYWVTYLHEQGEVFYLVLPDQKLKIDGTDTMLHRALSALALA